MTTPGHSAHPPTDKPSLTTPSTMDNISRALALILIFFITVLSALACSSVISRQMPMEGGGRLWRQGSFDSWSFHRFLLTYSVGLRWGNCPPYIDVDWLRFRISVSLIDPFLIQHFWPCVIEEKLERWARSNLWMPSYWLALCRCNCVGLLR